MEGHLFVVGWTSTPPWEKPRAFQTLVVFLLGANHIDGRRKLVGQDLYPSMGRFRKLPLAAMGGPGPSRWRDERTSTHSLWIEARDEMSPHE